MPDLERPCTIMLFLMQGKIESEYIAFTSKHKESKKYFCYLFLAKNSKMVSHELVIHLLHCNY